MKIYPGASIKALIFFNGIDAFMASIYNCSKIIHDGFGDGKNNGFTGC
ncbi:hypothetical protein LDG_7341 [Legionella drancourtii LLAP12]|uniref:Uncharacterized protein n=1 Tax=Legionella drancourtii LLAP12 TaxID=658187 RepID=G9EPZ9_9GAMM|nr:hypothetical protein LDG_7341 [Legionella drancourtii LLAP12]